MRILSFTLSMLLLAGVGFAQEPIYRITVDVVERTASAVNYQHRNRSTTINFAGTPLLPEANGEAKVESKQGYMEIEVEFDELDPATRFGPEYLTYVMWAITPEGRAQNLGEIILNGNRSKLNVTTEMQAFGLIVTAEPYFAVTQPSDVVVMENVVRGDTRGEIQQVEAKYQLLRRGQYTANVPPAELKPIELDKDTPLDLYQARNAVRIAGWNKAREDAAATFEKANAFLMQAEAAQVRDESERTISQAARQAVQTAEDARLIALRTQEEARQAAERRAAAERQAAIEAEADRANAAASLEAQGRAAAEQEQRLEAERRARAEAETRAAEAQARADAERAARERAAIQAEADRARQAAEQAEREKTELRASLIQQLNRILDTRDSARGLIVNMSDVLFDTAQYTLKPGAREKLAKVGGILLAHPGLMLQVEGHTDSVGDDAYNVKLSEQRAASVRDYLVQQGIPVSNITAHGMGESFPVADNATASGRQQNRRVELIVAGDAIGMPLKTSN